MIAHCVTHRTSSRACNISLPSVESELSLPQRDVLTNRRGGLWCETTPPWFEPRQNANGIANIVPVRSNNLWNLVAFLSTAFGHGSEFTECA